MKTMYKITLIYFTFFVKSKALAISLSSVPSSNATLLFIDLKAHNNGQFVDSLMIYHGKIILRL